MSSVSSCRRNTTSCVACCGVTNLAIDEDSLNNLLRQRTWLLWDYLFAFQKGPSHDVKSLHGYLVQYRTEQEELEKGIPRYSETTYVCPFAGFLSGFAKGEVKVDTGRPGCMIHPEIMKLPALQNASFYGTTICQSYDCPTKEADLDQGYSVFLETQTSDYISYSRFMADYFFFNVYKFYQEKEQANASDPAPDSQQSVFRDLMAERGGQSDHIGASSFEDFTRLLEVENLARVYLENRLELHRAPAKTGQPNRYDTENS